MTGTDRKRIAKIIGRLGSNQAGELTAAATALQAALVPVGGVRWLAETVTHGRPPEEQREAVRREEILQKLFKARLDNAVRHSHAVPAGELAVLAAAQKAGPAVKAEAMAAVLTIEARLR